MAKFKVGDKVKDTYWGGRYTATVKGVVPGARVQYVLDRSVGDDPNNYVAGEDEIVAANSSACNAPGVDPKRMIAYIKKIVSSINLKAFTGAHGPEIRYNGIPWEYGVALNPYSPEEVVVSAHTWKDAPKDDIKDMEEKVKRDTAKLVSKLNASGFSATPRFYSQTKVPIYILGEISAQHKGQNSVQPESASACNTLRPYGSWRAASRGNVHVGDYVIHKTQYASFKDDEEKLDRNSERVAGVQADGFWTDMSGTNELERYNDYYVFNAARVRNAVVAKALNARARNDKQFHTYLVPVLRKGVKDYVTIERVADEETAKKLVDVPSFRIIGVTVDETRPVKVAKNATALNFSPGDKVSIVDTDIRYGGDKGEVVRKDGFRYVVRLTSRQDKPEVTLQPNQLKAANAEDAQGHEHGSDGKFTSKGGGSDGGDSYEDPKTKRMKERLAKMREKNEALRKEIDQRKAALAGKKAETEKMRADVMKANVEKWKAGLPKTKNAIVARALNAVANAITGTGRVNYEDDLIVVYNPNGQQVYKGSVDDCPYKNDDWKYDASTRTYRVDGPNGDYRTIAKISNALAKNAEDDWVERFEVGGVYHGPYMNKDWLAKVLSRTDSSIRVAIKSRRDKTWHGKDEQVTLRINKRQAEEDGTEVAKGYGWEFWANDFE